MFQNRRVRALGYWPQVVGVSLAAVAAVLLIGAGLGHVSYTPSYLQLFHLHILNGVLAFGFVVFALVRFRTVRDRMSLVLALGFTLSGVVVTSASFIFYRPFFSYLAQHPYATLEWWVSPILLAVFFLAAFVVENRLPTSRHPDLEVGVAFVVAAGVAFLSGVILAKLPADLQVYPNRFFPRPWNLLPAGLFLVAAHQYHWRLQTINTPFDRGLYYCAVMNVVGNLAATQARRGISPASYVGQALEIGGYAAALGGVVIDVLRRYDEAHYLAGQDPLTGLVNYRRFMEVLARERDRTRRTGRAFAVLLLDVDGLKKINDRHGHLVGNRALCRLANVLCRHCRAIDTAARCGGDEFALVLPETTERTARFVATRIRNQLAAENEAPPVSASMGVAVYPRDALSIEGLLAAADADLYAAKTHQRDARSEQEEEKTHLHIQR